MGDLEMIKDIEKLLNMPYWIIDILPRQVEKDSPGQYFAIEKYYITEPQRLIIKQRHINIILKLNCYRDISLWEEDEINPDPEILADVMNKNYVNIIIDDALIVSAPDETYLTIYNPDEDLLNMLKILAAGEGLYVWRPEQ
jgi:hypothetical protein